MKFTTIISTLAVLGPAMAAPSAIVELPANMSPRADINEAEIFSFQTLASCSILGCINVIGSAVCVVDALKDKNFEAILKCAKKEDLCSCSSCFNDLGDFLELFGIC